jgi:LacI family transcriptional regulator
LRQSGIRVPADLSLVGFGDLPDAGTKVPPLTTVRIYFLEIGRELARMAIEKANPRAGCLPEVVVGTELILRGTTWPLLKESGTAISS